jgi:hypothetical protein
MVVAVGNCRPKTVARTARPTAALNDDCTHAELLATLIVPSKCNL